MVTTAKEVQNDLFEANQSPGSNNRQVERQKALLDKCVREDLQLDKVLTASGLSYDDLVYTIPEEYSPDTETERYFELDDFRKKQRDIPMVSFFSGCGGLDLGFEAAGFHHEILIDNNEIFCNTLRANRPEWDVVGPPNHDGDVSDLEGLTSILRSKLGRRKTFDGVFVGGPPCQPFSIAANQRFNKSGKNFKRTGFSHETNGNLLFDYIHFITEFKPYAFLIENVTGLMDIDGGKQLSNAIELLIDAGYKVEDPLVLDARNFKVPQQRRRLFLVGTRTKKNLVPPKPSSTLVSCWTAFEKSLTGVDNHATRKHKVDSIARYMRLRVGERDQLGRVDRLDPNKPSKTVIAGGTRGGGRSHLHPNIPRTLSVRECARLQTFPDDYVFTGVHARQFTQVGNAVPPVLATQLAKSILDAYFS